MSFKVHRYVCLIPVSISPASQIFISVNSTYMKQSTRNLRYISSELFWDIVQAKLMRTPTFEHSFLINGTGVQRTTRDLRHVISFEIFGNIHAMVGIFTPTTQFVIYVDCTRVRISSWNLLIFCLLLITINWIAYALINNI